MVSLICRILKKKKKAHIQRIDWWLPEAGGEGWAKRYKLLLIK